MTCSTKRMLWITKLSDTSLFFPKTGVTSRGILSRHPRIVSIVPSPRWVASSAGPREAKHGRAKQLISTYVYSAHHYHM